MPLSRTKKHHIITHSSKTRKAQITADTYFVLTLIFSTTLKLAMQSAEQNKLLQCPNQNEEGIWGCQGLDICLMHRDMCYINTASFSTAQV